MIRNIAVSPNWIQSMFRRAALAVLLTQKLPAEKMFVYFGSHSPSPGTGRMAVTVNS